MRLSEKSFEVRFCASLTAAAMPYERNPQWFGMTQAQERMTGIDTMLKVGGTLIILQFKAKNHGKFSLEKSQWRNLARLERRYQGSTFYVFPEADDVAGAASVLCLLRHSWCCSPQDIGPLFKAGALTTTIALDPANACLLKAGPKMNAGAETACQLFGCFCPPIAFRADDPNGSLYWLWPSHARSKEGVGSQPSILGGSARGIPIGDVESDFPDRKPLLSIREFEELLGEQAKRNLNPGLYGLFIPS